jgi:hypothetical protein
MAGDEPRRQRPAVAVWKLAGSIDIGHRFLVVGAGSSSEVFRAGWGLHGFVAFDPGQEVVEVGCGEFPLEWSGVGVVARFERGQALFDLVEVGEVVGGQDFALYDGEDDLDLV